MARDSVGMDENKRKTADVWRERVVAWQASGQGQLDQDAVDGRVLVQAVDQGEQFVLAGAGGQVMGLGNETDFLAVFALVRNIDLRGGIAAHQDHGQAGNAQSLLAAFSYSLGYLLAEAGGDRFAVDQLCGHDA